MDFVVLIAAHSVKNMVKNNRIFVHSRFNKTLVRDENWLTFFSVSWRFYS